MSEESKPSGQTTLAGMGSATSSPGSGAGRSLCVPPGGLRIIPCGQARALVSPSHRPARGSALTIRATSGLFGSRSLRSANLQWSLESRLRARLDGYGSLEYALTWKRWGMRSGLPICALRASAPRTCASVSIGSLRGWLTVRAAPKSEASHGQMSGGLRDQAKLAGWQTVKLPSGGAQPVRTTPGGGLHKLDDQAVLTSTLSGVPTELTGALNPEFTRWLQGFPTGWARLPGTGTP